MSGHFVGPHQRQELAVTKPKFLEFKGYMSCSIRDERTYYRKYLPKFPDLFLRSVFNDHLEGNFRREIRPNNWLKLRSYWHLSAKCSV